MGTLKGAFLHNWRAWQYLREDARSSEEDSKRYDRNQKSQVAMIRISRNLEFLRSMCLFEFSLRVEFLTSLYFAKSIENYLTLIIDRRAMNQLDFEWGARRSR